MSRMHSAIRATTVTSLLLSRSGGEKGLRGSGAGTLGVPLGRPQHVGGLLGVAGRLSVLLHFLP